MEPRGCTKLRSSLEAVLGWKSYLHDVTELPDLKNRAKKAVCGQEYTYTAVVGSLRRGLRRAIFDLGQACARSTRAPAGLSWLLCRGHDII